MTLEVANYIDDLNNSYPEGSSSFSAGDDHLRLIKRALQDTFKRANKTYYIGSYITKEASSLNKTSNYAFSSSIDNTDDGKCVSVDATAGDVTITLPTIDANTDGYLAFIHKSDASSNVVNIVPQGAIGELIDGAASFTLTTQYSTVGFYGLGTKWTLVSNGLKGQDARVFLNFDVKKYIGEKWEWPGTAESVPTGNIVCLGQSLSTIDFPELFAIFGYVHGGAGLSFNLPDPSGRNFIYAGQGNTAEGGLLGTIRARGETGGAEEHSLTEDQNGPHDHSVASNANLGPSGVNALQRNTNGSYRSGSSGLGTPHNNMSPWLCIGYAVIYTGRTDHDYAGVIP